MLVGYGEDGKMNATIITTKEEVDYQFWYPGRNKVIKEYKYIKDKYSWENEFDFKNESAKSTNSPKIYDLRTPQKKSRKMEIHSDDTSDVTFDLSKDDDYTQSGRKWESKSTTPTNTKKFSFGCSSSRINDTRFYFQQKKPHQVIRRANYLRLKGIKHKAKTAINQMKSKQSFC